MHSVPSLVRPGLHHEGDIHADFAREHAHEGPHQCGAVRGSQRGLELGSLDHAVVGRQKSVRFGDPLWTRRRASQSVVSRRLRVVSTGQPARHVSWSDFCPPYRSWTPAPSRLAQASLPSASPERYLTSADPASSQWTRTATPSSKLR